MKRVAIEKPFRKKRRNTEIIKKMMRVAIEKNLQKKKEERR